MPAAVSFSFGRYGGRRQPPWMPYIASLLEMTVGSEADDLVSNCLSENVGSPIQTFIAFIA